MRHAAEIANLRRVGQRSPFPDADLADAATTVGVGDAQVEEALMVEREAGLVRAVDSRDGREQPPGRSYVRTFDGDGPGLAAGELSAQGQEGAQGEAARERDGADPRRRGRARKSRESEIEIRDERVAAREMSEGESRRQRHEHGEEAPGAGRTREPGGDACWPRTAARLDGVGTLEPRAP